MLEDISFLGFDNIFWSNYTNPPLSTIKMPKKEFGKVGMKLLMKYIKDEPISKKKIILATELIERSSVLKIKT